MKIKNKSPKSFFFQEIKEIENILLELKKCKSFQVYFRHSKKILKFQDNSEFEKHAFIIYIG